MTTRLDIVNGGLHRTEWLRFRDYISENSPTPYYDIFEELAKFGGHNLWDTPYIEFEEDEDATAFLLRWSV